MLVKDLFEMRSIAAYDVEADQGQQRAIAIRQIDAASAALMDTDDMSPEAVVAWIKGHYPGEDVDEDLLYSILDQETDSGAELDAREPDLEPQDDLESAADMELERRNAYQMD